jgi:16S rRNA (guanine966-N2)-methyltransferase|tara:strand:+ start:241 stop:804 length:564 start_codon:yes stop_codon:yes gene_type:complete
MRIISGTSKGKKICSPNDEVTRPLKDLAKESIFNIIKHSNLLKLEIENSNILDLFSGVGSFGLECLSRGASNVFFYENYENALKILKKNIENLKFTEQTSVIESDIFNKSNFLRLENKFEIIFIDPPFKEKKIFSLIENIVELNLLKKKGIIIIHRNKKEKDNFPKEFNIILEKTYGISKIIFGNYI